MWLDGFSLFSPANSKVVSAVPRHFRCRVIKMNSSLSIPFISSSNTFSFLTNPAHSDDKNPRRFRMFAMDKNAERSSFWFYAFPTRPTKILGIKAGVSLLQPLWNHQKSANSCQLLSWVKFPHHERHRPIKNDGGEFLPWPNTFFFWVKEVMDFGIFPGREMLIKEGRDWRSRFNLYGFFHPYSLLMQVPGPERSSQLLTLKERMPFARSSHYPQPFKPRDGWSSWFPSKESLGRIFDLVGETWSGCVGSWIW